MLLRFPQQRLVHAESRMLSILAGKMGGCLGGGFRLESCKTSLPRPTVAGIPSFL